MTLQNFLEAHLQYQYPSWVHKGQILRREWKDRSGTTVLPSTVDRALRLLENKKIIAVKHEGKQTQYKWLPHALRPKYIIVSERVDDKLFV